MGNKCWDCAFEGGVKADLNWIGGIYELVPMIASPKKES